jgi:hypothetical protein
MAQIETATLDIAGYSSAHIAMTPLLAQLSMKLFGISQDLQNYCLDYVYHLRRHLSR